VQEDRELDPGRERDGVERRQIRGGLRRAAREVLVGERLVAGRDRRMPGP